jgi:hypothetical protein
MRRIARDRNTALVRKYLTYHNIMYSVKLRIAISIMEKMSIGTYIF